MGRMSSRSNPVREKIESSMHSHGRVRPIVGLVRPQRSIIDFLFRESRTQYEAGCKLAVMMCVCLWYSCSFKKDF